MPVCSNCYSSISENDLVYSCVDQAPMHKECANVCPNCGGYLTDMQFARNKCKCIVQKKSSLELVRRSHIELYKQCPYAFYLECIKEEKQENNAYALHGIILHEIFDKYSKMENIVEEDLRNEFMERFEREVPRTHYSFEDNEALYDKLIEKGIDAICGFMQFYYKAPQPYITEENIVFELEEGLPKVSITMDRVDKDEEGNLHFYDYKCGKTFTGKKLEEDLQVPLYCYASYRQYGTFPQSFTFLFVSEGKERKYTHVGCGVYECVVRNTTYTINIQERLGLVKALLHDIKNEQFSTKCGNAWHCKNMCYYHKQNICEGQQGGWNF